jgi:hypothetical protein
MCTCVLALAGCSGGAAHGTGKISGELWAEHLSTVDGLYTNAQDGARGRLVILSAGKIVSTVMTALDGGFAISVPAGRYTVRGPATAAGSCVSTPRTLRVQRGKVSSVQVFCPRASRQKVVGPPG